MRKLFLITIATLAFHIVFVINRGPMFGADAGNAGENSAMKLAVADAVFIALTNNVTLRSAYLDRYLNRLDLELAERRYYLSTDSALTIATNRISSYVAPSPGSAAGRIDDLSHAGNVSATLAMPTGGAFTFVWNNSGDRPDTGQNFNYASDWSVMFRQPLLKGGGLTNAAYGVRIARIAEERNILSLKDTITATIRAAITAFRNYKTAERQLVIAEMGLVPARQFSAGSANVSAQ